MPYYFYYLLSWMYSPLWFVAGAFWLWMLVDCIRNEPERDVWLWLILILNVPGAVVYFLARRCPRLVLRPPAFLARFLRRQELARAEVAARRIGNPHQFVALGDILLETGRPERAAEAYNAALERDGSSLPALWGAASAEMKTQRFAEARGHLAAVLEADPGYKFGDASLAYGEALLGLGELDAARSHIEDHMRRRDDPEAHLLLARVCAGQGDGAKAREWLDSLIEDLKAARDLRSRRARRSAKKLLPTLPR